MLAKMPVWGRWMRGFGANGFVYGSFPIFNEGGKRTLNEASRDSSSEINMFEAPDATSDGANLNAVHWTLADILNYIQKKTEHKIKIVSTGAKRGTLKRGSLARAKLRGSNRGIGNKGKYSKPAVSKFKRKTKTTKKTNIMYTCSECKKSKYRASRRNKRTGKVLQE